VSSAFRLRYDAGFTSERVACSTLDTVILLQNILEDRASYFEAFIGQNSAYYLAKWARYRFSWFRGISWAALLFSGLWLFYRKLYLHATIFFLVITVDVFIVDYILVTQDDPSPFWARWDRFSPVFYALLTAINGNAWYYRKCSSAVDRVLSSEKDDTKRLRLLSQQGGVSPLSPTFGFFFFLILVVALSEIVGDFS